MLSSIITLMVVAVGGVLASSDAQKGDFCNSDKFSPRCYHADEIVVVTAATFGLLDKTSRCVVGIDPESTEVCSANVLELLSGECSGRKSCSVQVSTLNRSAGHCPASLASKFYLNASYECVKVEVGACATCREDEPASIKAAKSGRLAGIVTAEADGDSGSGCGTSKCPWSIEVQPGQVINITLVDYASVSPSAGGTAVLSSGVGQRPRSSLYSGSSWGGEAQCAAHNRYAVVKERANPRETIVCGGVGGGNRRHVYTSISNIVEIHVNSRDWDGWKGQFVIEYEAIGCPDLIPPLNTWMKRASDRVEVGCPTTNTRWVLNCVGGAWVGDVGKRDSCPGVPGVVIPGPGSSITDITKPDPGPVQDKEEESSFFSAIPYTILIAAVVAVACIIGVLILTTGIVCIKKHQYKKRHRPARPSSIYTRATEEFEFRGEMPNQNGAGEAIPMMMTNMPPGAQGHGSSRPIRGQPPPTATKPQMLSQQAMASRRVLQDGGAGGHFIEVFDPEQRQMVMIGNRPLPSLPGTGSADRRGSRPGPGQPFQTTALMHPQYPQGMPMQYPGGGYPMQHPHAECTCSHGPPRGPRYPGAPGGMPGYQTQPPPLAPKVRSVGTGPVGADGWGGYGTVGGNSMGRFGEGLYGNEDPQPYRQHPVRSDGTAIYSEDQHHYFVLDSDLVRDRPPPSPTPSERMAAAAAAAAANSLSSAGKSGRTVEYGILGTSGSGDQRFPTPPPPLPEAVAADTVQPQQHQLQQQQQQQQQQQMPPPQTPAAKIIADETVSNRRQSPDGKERDEMRADGTATVEELGKNGGRCSVHEIPLRPSRDGPVAVGGVPMPKGAPVNENEALLANASNMSSWP